MHRLNQTSHAFARRVHGYFASCHQSMPEMRASINISGVFRLEKNVGICASCASAQKRGYSSLSNTTLPRSVTGHGKTDKVGQAAVRLLAHSYGIHTMKGSCSWFNSTSLGISNCSGKVFSSSFPILFKRFSHSGSAVKDIGGFLAKERRDKAVAKSARFASTINTSSGNGRLAQDLLTFLMEVGTAEREARYWLRQFQQGLSDPLQPFALMHVDQSVFRDPDTVKRLGTCLSFLQRNGMKVIVTYGYSSAEGVDNSELWNYLNEEEIITPEGLQDILNQVYRYTVNLNDAISEDGAPTRPLFFGCGVVQASHIRQYGFRGQITGIKVEPIHWCLETNHVPIIPNIGLSPSGQLLVIDLTQLSEEIAKSIHPLKVMFLNSCGGIHDDHDRVIGTINLPGDLDHCFSEPWCTSAVREKIQRISSLINYLPSKSSVVITSAPTVLKELFTHHGSGTFFKSAERILSYTSFDDVDLQRLLALINRSFDMNLKEDYFDCIRGRLNTLYLSETYSAAAIVTNETGTGVPYLDKFVVGQETQGQGTGEMLWAHLSREFRQLFWRSKTYKRITPWYFRRADGSWSNGEWVVFWYGVTKYKTTSDLIDFALNLPPSFIDDPSRANGQMKKKKGLSAT